MRGSFRSFFYLDKSSYFLARKYHSFGLESSLSIIAGLSSPPILTYTRPQRPVLPLSSASRRYRSDIFFPSPSCCGVVFPSSAMRHDFQESLFELLLLFILSECSKSLGLWHSLDGLSQRFSSTSRRGLPFPASPR